MWELVCIWEQVDEHGLIFLFVITENSGSSASINTMDDQICVTCPGDDVPNGCVVVLHPSEELQSIMSHKISQSELRCFPQKQSGEYTVAVFKQIMNNALQENPLNVSMVTISISTSTQTTCKLDDYPTQQSHQLTLMWLIFSYSNPATPASSTFPEMPSRDDVICPSGCIAGIVVGKYN